MKPKIIIAADSGTAGENAALKATKSVGKLVLTAKHPKGKTPDNYDFNDLMQDGGLEAVKKMFINLPAEKGFNLTRYSEIELTHIQWLIKALLPVYSLITLVAPPATGKTFIALDMACCLAAGIHFHSYKVSRRHTVVFVAGEGVRGIKLRVAAWLKHQALKNQDINLFISNKAADIFKKPKRLVEEIEQIGSDIDLIIYDTLNRNTPAVNENDTKEMSIVVRNIDAINREFSCTSIVTHHTPHTNPKRGRGSSSLVAAVDCEFLLEKTGGNGIDAVTLTCTKMKDSPAIRPLILQAIKIDLGIKDEDGEAITSLVFDDVDDDFTAVKPKLGKNQQALLSEIQELAFNDRPINVDEAFKNSKLDVKRKKETIEGLINKGLIKVEGEICHIV